MIRRIVVIRAGALGDTILTIPAIRALRERNPEAQIEVIGYPDLWEVAGSLVDRRISIERPVLSGLLTGDASPGLLAWIRGGSDAPSDAPLPVDLAIAWTQRNPRPIFEAAGVGQIIHASPFPPPGIHAAGWYLQSLDLPIVPGDGPHLSLSSEERHAGRQALREQRLDRPIILHPGAGATWKRWPAQRFGVLAMALRQRDHDVALLAGPADEEAIEATLAHSGPLPILRSDSIRHLAAILSQAHLFVGNDSGVTHLAAAVGVPTIALFGPTDPASWAPLGKVRLLRRCTATTARQGQIRVCEAPACMEGIGVEDVLAEVRGVSDEGELGIGLGLGM
jgi:ADP-heptose:LPS heptosyltransferase